MEDLSFAFIIFFVTLGPLKVIPAYAGLTRNFTAPQRNSLALKSAILATIIGLAIIFVGNNLRQKWGIERPDLLITGGILLLIGALESLRNAQHKPEREAPPSSPEGLALSPVTFPIIITPYGIVALLLFAAVVSNTQTFLIGVFAIFLGMMFADYLSMRYAGPLLRFIRPGSLLVLSWLIAVLQASLAVHAVLEGLRAAGALPLHT